MATAKSINLNGETREIEDSTARAAASAASAAASAAATGAATAESKADQALLDASEALNETVALEADLNDRITEVVKPFLTTRETLWTNTNPSAGISQLSVPVPTGYDEYWLKWKLYAGQGNVGQITRVFTDEAKDQWINIMGTSDFYPPNNGYVYSRDIQIDFTAGNMSFEFHECFSYDFSGDSSPAEQERPTNCIPFEIIGIKYGTIPS